MSRLDSIIGAKYLCDGSPAPEDQMHIAYMRLENDISSSLSESADIDKTFDEICEILKESPLYSDINEVISLHTAYRRAKIRSDFATALRNVKNGSALSGVLGLPYVKEAIEYLNKEVTEDVVEEETAGQEETKEEE